MRSGAGRVAPGKGSRQVETGNSHGASQPASTATCTVPSNTASAATCAACVPSDSPVARGVLRPIFLLGPPTDDILNMEQLVAWGVERILRITTPRLSRTTPSEDAHLRNLICRLVEGNTIEWQSVFYKASYASKEVRLLRDLMYSTAPSAMTLWLGHIWWPRASSLPDNWSLLVSPADIDSEHEDSRGASQPAVASGGAAQFPTFAIVLPDATGMVSQEHRYVIDSQPVQSMPLGNREVLERGLRGDVDASAIPRNLQGWCLAHNIEDWFPAHAEKVRQELSADDLRKRSVPALAEWTPCGLRRWLRTTIGTAMEESPPRLTHGPTGATPVAWRDWWCYRRSTRNGATAGS